MSAMLEFYFRFRFLRLHHHPHVILHLSTNFRPNRTIGDRVMTSYPLFKMAATSSELYFWFRFSWLRSFGKVQSVQIYQHTKFWRDTSIHGCDITTSGFWKQTPPCWNSTSGFDFHVCITNGMLPFSMQFTKAQLVVLGVFTVRNCLYLVVTSVCRV